MQADALLLQNVDFDLLLSRPDMELLKINILWNDEVVAEGLPNHCNINQQPPKIVKDDESVPVFYPE